jgi:metallo-beta-lactamase class B
MTRRRPLRASAALALTLACASTNPAPHHRPEAALEPSLPAQGQSVHIDAELTIRRIDKDAFVVTHEPAFASNILVVRMNDGALVLCSSPFDTEATRSMLRWLRTVFAPRRIVAINAHYHPDGTAGNEAYAEAAVETYATDLTQRLLAERGARALGQAAGSFEDPGLVARVRATRVVPANHTIGQDETLTIGGETIRVMYPGPAHSPDNVVVHFPARKLLFGGCMIKTGPSIGNLADADLGHWEAAVRSVARLGALTIVPGHGPVGGPELLQHTIDVVRAVQGAPGR